MEWQDLLGELVTFVKSAAPDLWAIMRQQVMIDVVRFRLWGYVTGVLGGILLILFTVSLIQYRRIVNGMKARREWGNDGDGWMGTAITAIIFAVPLLFTAISLFADAYARSFNPDYYVIKQLIGMIAK